MSIGKRGAPRKSEEREKLEVITFKVDKATKTALFDLQEAETQAGVLKGQRSSLLRRLILEARSKLK